VGVRFREQGDLEQCVELLAAVHDHSGYPVRWPEDPLSWLSPPNLAGAWVSEIDGRVVGHVVLVAAGAGRQGRGDTAEISRLFVSPTARGQGVGTDLLNAGAQAARSQGWSVWLKVIEGDGSAARFYERRGWRRLDRRPASWTTAAGHRPVLLRYLGPLSS
jgi:GNAT superfamily N-acetyltransferase